MSKKLRTKKQLKAKIEELELIIVLQEIWAELLENTIEHEFEKQEKESENE